MLGISRAGQPISKFVASSAIETGLSQINDPKQGARLVRAFLRITNRASGRRSFRWLRRFGLRSRLNRDRYRLPQQREPGGRPRTLAIARRATIVSQKRPEKANLIRIFPTFDPSPRWTPAAAPTP